MRTPCILWTKSINDRGYGKLRVGSKFVYAHRYEWEKHHGPIPDGMQIMHLCNVRNCINIEHLQLGTAKENTEYMYECGRQGRSTLTKNQQKEIIFGYDLGQSARELAEEFGISVSQVHRIIRAAAIP